ncbi:MAG TPA: DUF885 domain-containing protein, partial [Gemmatimonadales bacterium]
MINRGILMIAAVTLLAACSRGPRPGLTPAPIPTAANATTDSAAFEQFVTRYLNGSARPRRRTEPADSLAWLKNYEAAADTRAANEAAGMLAELRTIDTTHLTVPQRIDWLLAESWLKRSVYDTILHNAERVPGRYLTLGDLYFRVAGDRPPTTEVWAGVRQDLERAPRIMAVGHSQLKSPPPLWIHLAAGTAASYADFLGGDFVQRVHAAAPDSMQAGILAAATNARAALIAWRAWLTDTLQAGGEGSWASGADYYDWVLREVNFLPFTAATMIDEGRRIHAATKLALDSFAQRTRPGTSWHVLADEMRTRHPEPGHITEAYRTQSHKVLALLIRDDLIRIPPGQELVFVPTPLQLRETYAWGGYGGITMRDSIATGRFFVTDIVPSMTPAQVAEKLRTQNNGWISVIALHEGYPGHHLAEAYAIRNDRRLRRIGGNTYYGEGWALYAEHWMARRGLFADNPDGQLGQLQMRLWRTARVIIDPSLHTGRMTYEEAVRFFMDEVGLERSAAEAEVNRFTTWPTQAPSYIVGWLEIERLERDVQQALGPRFTEKEFVEKVLEAGPLPPALMRRAVLF